MNYRIEKLIDEREVSEGIKSLAESINRDYRGESIRLVCILKGGVFFMTELAKHLSSEVTMDFMSVSSYGAGTESSGVVKIIKDLDESIEGENVLVVEDIVDTGNTLSYLMDLLRDRKPKTIKLCTLLDKPSRRTRDIKADYVAFTIPDKFVVGYGLDYDQKYRNLPYIGVVEFDD